MFEDMSHTSGTPFVSGTKSNSTPASKQFYILVRRVPNDDISNITTCTATNVFFYDLILLNLLLFVIPYEYLPSI